MLEIGGVVGGVGLAGVLATRLLLVGLVLYLERRGHPLTDIARVVRSVRWRR